MKLYRSSFAPVLLLLLSSPLWATLITDNNSAWVPFAFLPASEGGTAGQVFDAPNDQQTGDKAADFVGTATIPGLYIGFNGLGDNDPLTGNLMFRARLGALGSPDFSSAFVIGIDANLDGQIDLFVGADQRSPSKKAIVIWGGDCSKTPCDTSPSTTGLGTQQGSAITETAANYYYTAVNTGLDVGNTSFDLNGDGAIDAFLTFSVDIGLIRTYVQTLNLQYPGGGTVPAFDENSPLRIIAITSQQSNSFNQDLGGCAVINSTVGWNQCGMSATFTASKVNVPEPGTVFLAGAGLASLWYIRRRKHTQA